MLLVPPSGHHLVQCTQLWQHKLHTYLSVVVEEVACPSLRLELHRLTRPSL